MKRYRWLQRAFTIIIVGYVLIAVGRHMRGQGEFYPLFVWDLFTYVPEPTVQDYGLHILAINGTPLEPPLYFEQADTFFKHAHSIEAQTVIGQLASGVHNGSHIDQPRAYLEQQYLADQPQVLYAIVLRSYNLLDRWKSNTFLEETVLHVFEKQP